MTASNLETIAEKTREVAGILLSVGAVSINVAEPFTYASGAKSPIYCDNRLLMSYPEERTTITRYLAEQLDQQVGFHQIDVLAGVATSGIPFAAWLAEHLRKPMVYVREVAKAHGKGQQIEGLLKRHQRAVVIEDLVTTGGSALAAIEGVRSAGGRADCCAAIFTYESAAADRAFHEAGVQLLTLCGISALLEVATTTARITQEDRVAAEAWQASLSSRS